MGRQLGIESAFQASLDQLLDQTVLALQLQLTRIDLGIQIIKHTSLLQCPHTLGLDPVTLHSFLLINHTHQYVCFLLGTTPYTNNLTPSEVDIKHSGSGVEIDRTRVSKNATPVNTAQMTAPPGLELSTLAPSQRDVFGTGFHPLYEWFCRAEVQIQQTVTRKVTELDISDFVAHYLRHIAYWGPVDYGAWLVYTPWPNDATEPGLFGVAIAAIETLEKWDGSYSLPPSTVFKMIDNSDEINYDAPHFAASYLGYRNWGVVNLPTASYTFGDLGGWAMDLLSLWGKYVEDGKPANLRTWTRDHIGVLTGSFSKVDVIGDADAFLMAKAVTSGDRSVSEMMRSVFTKNQNDRIKLFYDARFQASAQKIVDAYTGILFDGNEIPLIGSWAKVKVLKSLAKTSSIPSQVEAKNMALGYADYMAGLR